MKWVSIAMTTSHMTSMLQCLRYREMLSCCHAATHPDDGLTGGVGDDQEVQRVVVVHLEGGVDALEEVLGPALVRAQVSAIDERVAAVCTLCSGRANASYPWCPTPASLIRRPSTRVVCGSGNETKPHPCLTDKSTNDIHVLVAELILTVFGQLFHYFR